MEEKKLLHACEYKTVAAVDKYIDLGADVNCKDISGDTPLHLACGRYRIIPEIITTLLKNNCIPNIKNSEGETALHLAVNNFVVTTGIITTLLENGFKPAEKDNLGQTVLHVAIDQYPVNLDLIKILVKYDTNPDEKDVEGKTVLHMAVSQYHKDENMIRSLLKNGIKTNEKDNEGRTALHIAACEGRVNPNIIQALLEYDCFPKERDKMGRTALHLAAEQDYVDPYIVTTLLENGCNNQKDNKGNTALHVASFNGNTELIHVLISRGCSPFIVNHQKQTPRNVAVNYQVKQILKKYEENLQLGLPVEVKELDKKSALLFTSLLEEEGYLHFEARVMIVGEQETGKTTIARYLTGNGPTKIRISTDGIDLYNGLSFIDRETEEWLHDKKDFTMSEFTISRSLRQSKDTSTKGLWISNSSYQDEKSLHERAGAFETFTSVADASSNLKPCSKDISSNKQLCLNETEHVKRGVTLDVDEELQGGKNCTKMSKNDRLSVESSKLKDSHSTSRDEPELQPISDILERKQTNRNTTETCSAVISEESTEVNLSTSNTVIPPLQVIHGNNPNRSVKENKMPLSVKSHSRLDIGFLESSTVLKVIRDTGIIGKLQKMFRVKKDVKEVKVSMSKEDFLKESVKAGKKKLHQMKLAPVIIWDFGGQDVFYSTHQTFLTYRAFYLLVLDGSRNLDDPCPFEQYLPGKSGRKTARDYLRFWINTIVTYCKGSVPGFPKIMIVLTHKDKLTAVEVEPKRQQLFDDIEKMFSGCSLMSHLVIKDKIFVNARNKHDPEMAKINSIIIKQAMQQPTWGQKLPKYFIPLELEFDLLQNRNIPLITMDHLKTINNVQPVRPLEEDELKVFLKFQHAVGRILYFDETKLDQHIILAPTHLIDAFKSIVTDRRFCEGDRLRVESWDLMSQKGVIGKKSIEDIWKESKYKKFQDHKEYLLGVMTHLDILVEPKRYDKLHKHMSAEFYYVPSMVRNNDTTGYFASPTIEERTIAIAFSQSSSMIPPALSFRFISYCLSKWAVKKYGQNNDEMLFHRSAVFTIDQSLDMCVDCEDEMIVVRLVHSRNRTLIMRDLASSIRECLAVALGKISQLYVKTGSREENTGKDSFNIRLCCSSPFDPCFLPLLEFDRQDGPWICHKHGNEHTKDVLSSWITQKEDIQCGEACPVTNEEFLKQIPEDIHLLRLSMQFSVNETKELANHLGMQYSTWERLYLTFVEEPERLNFETMRKCLDGSHITFNDIRKAVESGSIQNPHIICKVVREKLIDFDHEPEKWDIETTEEHFDRLAPLVGNNSLAFLVELGMEFQTWEQIRFKQSDRDLVKLNRDILQEWKTFCNINTIRPSLRHIGQAFNNIGKNIKIVEHLLADFF